MSSLNSGPGWGRSGAPGRGRPHAARADHGPPPPGDCAGRASAGLAAHGQPAWRYVATPGPNLSGPVRYPYARECFVSKLRGAAGIAAPLRFGWRLLALGVDDDASAAQLSARRSLIPGPHLVVVDDLARRLVPDLDAELIGATTAHLTVDGGQHDAVAALSIDGAFTLVLGPGPGNSQPLVAGAVELQVAGLVLELRLSRRGLGALLVLNPKVALPVVPSHRLVSLQASAGDRIHPPPVTNPPSGSYTTT